MKPAVLIPKHLNMKLMCIDYADDTVIYTHFFYVPAMKYALSYYLQTLLDYYDKLKIKVNYWAKTLPELSQVLAQPCQQAADIQDTELWSTGMSYSFWNPKKAPPEGTKLAPERHRIGEQIYKNQAAPCQNGGRGRIVVRSHRQNSGKVLLPWHWSIKPSHNRRTIWGRSSHNPWSSPQTTLYLLSRPPSTALSWKIHF